MRHEPGQPSTDAAAPTGAGDDATNSATALTKLRALLAGWSEGSGARLPTERALSERLGVGRRAVRRALEVLEAEGRIWRRQGAGTFLGDRPHPDRALHDQLGRRTSFHEVMEARLRLEPQLARLAALKATPDDVEKMRVLAARIAEARDADARELWDGSLHRQIARATQNALLLGLFDVVDAIRQDEAWTALRERARSASSHADYRAQHEDIVAAIARRDPQEAEAAMRRHVETLQRNLIRTVEGEARAAE